MSDPAPLRLGTAEGVHLHARVEGERVVIEADAPLSKRGAAYLAEWLLGWARPRASRKLWGAGDIQRELGVSRSTLHKWRKRRDFPEPAETASGPIWEAATVKAWAKVPRPTGRPPKRR